MKSSKRKEADGTYHAKNGKKSKTEPAETQPFDDFMSRVHAFILPACIEKARLQIFRTQLTKFGGRVDDKIEHDTTHVVVDDKMDHERMFRVLKMNSLPDDMIAVKCAWLGLCYRQKKLANCDDFILEPPDRGDTKEGEQHSIQATSLKKECDFGEAKTTSSSAQAADDRQQFFKAGVMFSAFKRPEKNSDSDGDADSDYLPSDDEDRISPRPSTSSDISSSDSTPNTSPLKNAPVGKWICAQSSKNMAVNLNKHITDKLEEMVRNYESTNDKWRVFGYQKAIQALKKHPKAISSWEEARRLPNVGERLADKIWEIAESGELRKLNEFQSSEELQVLKLFTNVWGAGAHTARLWYQQGFRTLEDLRSKAHLTSQQKVGVRLYDDLLDRMPRSEAAEIEKVVREAAESLQPDIIAKACGSYRRGKPTCGDVDVLITHPDGKSHRGIFAKLIAKLKESGFLTDDLVSVEEMDNQKKYLGVCRLPGPDRKHRRLDIIVVPFDEYGCALVYFTGSAHFNRSLRHLCKKMNMSLNEHALKTGVVRKGTEKIYEGTTIPTPTEESVFKALNVPCRPPEERDH